MLTTRTRLSFDPLMPLHATSSRECPVVCVPGAGASLTSFVDFTEAVGSRWPIYGLQPRGVDLVDEPHQTVEAAALCNVKALEPMTAVRPVHLIGHSYGGQVAFEMALRLQEQGSAVASLTLIDSDAPAPAGTAAPQRESSDIFREFTEAFEGTFEGSIDIDKAALTSGDPKVFAAALHAALVKAGWLPARSRAEVLLGPLATFTAAVRGVYIPDRVYDGKVNLAVVNARRVSSSDDFTRREVQVAQWRRHVGDLAVWHGPGHHFSILRAPQVRELAAWWRSQAEL
jgi:thioesterase domain-containing protein